VKTLLAVNPHQPLTRTSTDLLESGLSNSSARRSTNDAVPVLIWAGRLSGERYFTGEAWTELTGRPRRDGRGYAWLRALHPADRGRYLAAHRDAVEHGRPYRLRYLLRDASGRYRSMIGTGVPCYSENGSLLSFVGVDIEAAPPSGNLDQRGEDSRASGFLTTEPSEEERRQIRRLVADLRGELNSRAMKIRSQFGRLRRSAERSSQPFALDQVASLLDQADDLLRNASHELDRRMSPDAAFAAALRWLARRTERQHGIPVAVEVAARISPLDPRRGTLAYSATRAALREMAHWGAARITLGLTSTGDSWMRLSIRATRSIAGAKPGFDEFRDIGRSLASARRRIETAGGSLAVHQDSPQVIAVVIEYVGAGDVGAGAANEE